MKGFALAQERVSLNRELVDLARQFGDVPGLFRSHLRLIIDACELNDRSLLDESVEACEQIARKIDLPHYSWRAASAKAIQATIEGDYEKAMALLDEAKSLAEQIDDSSALLTLPLQRLMILCDWDSPAGMDLDKVQLQLNRAFKLFPEAEIYSRTFMACATSMAGQPAQQLLSDAAFIERIFTTGDHFSISLLGKMAVEQGDADLAQRVYDTLLPIEKQGTTLGLMGSNWGGPVDLTLGRISAFLGNADTAWEHLENALSACTRMRAGPVKAHVHSLMANLAHHKGDDEVLRHEQQARLLCERLALRESSFSRLPMAEREVHDEPPGTAVAEANPFAMERQGDIWQVVYGGEATLIKNSKGMEMLAMLVTQPDHEILSLDLVNPAASSQPTDKGDSGPILDDRSRAEYKQRVADLRLELEDAESRADIGRAEALREELDFISRELSRAFGLGGRQRATGSAMEKARVNAQRRLRDAIGRIEAQLPDAGRYLKNTVKTGRYCIYSPA